MSSGTEQEIARLVDSLMDDYKRDDGYSQGNAVSQLDKEAIIEIVHKLQQIVFPGHFKDKRHCVYTMRNSVSMLVEDVLHSLSRQVEIVLAHEPEGLVPRCFSDSDDMAAWQCGGSKDTVAYAVCPGCTREEIAKSAHERCVAFLERLPAIRQLIETDVLAAYDGDPAAYNTDEIIFSYPGLYATMVNRLAHELYLLSVPLIPRIMTEYAHGATGIDIHPGATIGKYFFIDHGTGIVIGETTVIGDNVKVYQGVTLGALSTKGGQKLKNKKRHPTIEDNVTIYSGASILGGETVIGSGAVIGSNAFITSSVAAGTRVSIKNQELSLKSGETRLHSMEFRQDEAWFYTI